MKIVKGYACMDDELHSKWIEETGKLDHDTWLMKHLFPFIKDGMTVLDCGSHIGTHAMWYSNTVGYNGQVIAIEANPKAHQCLVYNCKGIKNIQTHNVALGAEPGTVTIKEVEGNGGMAYTQLGGNIPMITIDSLNLNKLDFVKIDCEGAEPAILEGAMKTLERLQPVLFIEVNREALKRNDYTPEDIYEKLITLQYSYRNIYETENMDGAQFDIICLPNKRFL